MLTALKTRGRRLTRWLGLSPTPLSFPAPLPFWDEAMARVQHRIIRAVRPYTQTSPERIAALCQAIAQIENRRVPGAIVECGVWKGGSVLAASLALLQRGSTCRQLYLFDTFDGMPPPEEIDRDQHGRPAHALLLDSNPEAEFVRGCCGLHEVRATLAQTRYPWEKLIFVPGRVEETLPAEAPSEIALLRLDTDWYASTRHELETLYPRLSDGGVLIIDDYGHWQGARQAVDEYFARRGEAVTLHALDYTGRLLVKHAAAAIRVA